METSHRHRYRGRHRHRRHHCRRHRIGVVLGLRSPTPSLRDAEPFKLPNTKSPSPEDRTTKSPSPRRTYRPGCTSEDTQARTHRPGHAGEDAQARTQIWLGSAGAPKGLAIKIHHRASTLDFQHANTVEARQCRSTPDAPAQRKPKLPRDAQCSNAV